MYDWDNVNNVKVTWLINGLIQSQIYPTNKVAESSAKYASMKRVYTSCTFIAATQSSRVKPLHFTAISSGVCYYYWETMIPTHKTIMFICTNMN